MRDDVGMENPLFIGVAYGKNKMDFWEENKKMWNMLGEDGQELFSDALKLTKKRRVIELFHIEELTAVRLRS